jgi:predicted transposase YbfD/YdcC
MEVNKNNTVNNTTILDFVRNSKLVSFLEYFQDIKDSRDSNNGNFLYHKLDLLLLCLVGSLCGEATQNGIYRFGFKNHKFLKSYYMNQYSKSVSLTTLHRFINSLEELGLRNGYVLWLDKVIGQLKLNKSFDFDFDNIVVSYDGKKIQTDEENFMNSKQSNLILYSGFIQHLKVVFDWNVFEGGKKSEISEFKDMIKNENSFKYISNDSIRCVTSDCLNTKQNTLKLLNEKKIGYVFAVKQNTPLLLHTLKGRGRELKHSFNESRNRFETKSHKVEVNVYSISKDFEVKSRSKGSDSPKWDFLTCGILRLIRVNRTSKKTKQSFVFWYISNIKLKTQEYFSIIRNHWSIENNLHREKDMVFKEDHHNYGSKQAKTFFTSLSNISISILNLHKMGSISQSTKNLSFDLERCVNLMGIEGR